MGDVAAPRAGIRSVLNRNVVVASLGYFVDIYDLIIFAVVSVASLRALGYTDPAVIRNVTGDLLGIQMLGMLAGGFLWGILGDKKGRLSVLFGSIALYSAANLANAFVVPISSATPLGPYWTYAALRFVAGVGLAGELGAAVTLVSEVMTKEARGYGTALVAAIGVLGALAGGWVALNFGWQMAYVVGGVGGFVLLVARVALAESGMFKTAARSNVARGNVLMLLAPPRLGKFVRTTLVGLPLWCVIGIFITLSPAIARDLGIRGVQSAIYPVMFAYAGISLGGLLWGTLSQLFRTRRDVLLAAVATTALAMFVYFFARSVTPTLFYIICFFLGVGAGYWAVFVTAASEQFGTNLRATASTLVPNLIRGSTFPLTLIFNHVLVGVFGEARSALILGALCILVALGAIRSLPETFGKDLDYVETTRTPAKSSRPAPSRTPA